MPGQRHSLQPNQTPIFRRLALRAFELAGRRPWFALLTLRVFFAMTKTLRAQTNRAPIPGATSQ